MSIQTAIKYAGFSSFFTTNTQLFSAFLIGVIVVLCVGFLPMDAVHNAAHDTRHALAFPCH